MKGEMKSAKMKPGIAQKGTSQKPQTAAKKGYSHGGRVSPLADVASRNPLAYGAK